MISEKTYIKATSVEQAVSLATQHKDNCRYLAGGTDVMVNKFQGNDNSAVLIDILGIDELREIRNTGTHLVIGSLVNLYELQNHGFIAKEFPVLATAAQSVAAPTLRRTATLGGNLLCENRCLFYNQSEWWREAAGYCLKCNGSTCLASGGTKNCLSKFVSDTAIALISLYAMAEVVEENKSQMLPLEEIYSGDGIHPLKLKSTTLVKAIHIPLDGKIRAAYHKLRKRETLDFTSLTTAVSLDNKGKIRIVLGGVHPKPLLVEASAEDNPEELIRKAIAETRIVDNDTYSRAYRKAMIPVFLKRSFNELDILTP